MKTYYVSGYSKTPFGAYTIPVFEPSEAQAELDELNKKLDRIMKRNYQKNVWIKELVDMLEQVTQQWPDHISTENYDNAIELIAKHR